MKRLRHLAIIAQEMGVVFELLSAATFVPFVILFYFQEWDMLIPMGMVPLVFFSAGFMISRLPRVEHTPHLSIALVAVAITWLTIALVGSIPFQLALGMPPTDSIFEAMSGWTGTGYSMVRDLDALPRTLVFWRSYMQWIGGLGVIAFGIAMQSRSGLAAIRLYRSEGRSEALMPSVVSTGRRMWLIYLFLTALFTILVMFSGVAFWDSLNMVMVSLATGGFAMYNTGMAHWDNALFEAFLALAMLAGALPFKLYFLMYRGQLRPFFRNPVVRLILFLAIAGSLLVSANLWLYNDLAPPDAIRQGFFCTISGITCTGLQNANPHAWYPIPVIVITLLMMMGGAAGSTAGGIKADRIVLAYQGLVWWFRRFFVRGNVVVPFRYGGKNIPRKISDFEISKNMLIIVMYVLCVALALVACLQIVTTTFRVDEILFELVSAMSNVGLGLGYLTVDSPLSIKWIYILLMWIGRLEIIPVVILTMGIARGFDVKPHA